MAHTQTEVLFIKLITTGASVVLKIQSMNKTVQRGARGGRKNNQSRDITKHEHAHE